ncbi:MAG: flagellar M-ring protein FliF, partial [Clostridiales bacterium]|nr:flagellar M-ring protein FliF [Clostridiales bacterium]
ALIMMLILFTRPEYVVLYSQLDSKEAAEIYGKLESLKIEPKLEGTSTILVPKDKEAQIRMELTREGYPQSGFNYDLVLDSSGLGKTDDEKRTLEIYQLQERLAQSIKILDGVEDAIVTIAMPKSDNFVLKTDRLPTTVAVIIRTELGYEISPEQAKNIESLIAKSVPGLIGDNISIIDTNMNILNVDTQEDMQNISSHFVLQQNLEERLKKQVDNLLEPVFGYKRIATSVSVRLNFDKKTTESVQFEPVVDDEGIAVSREELREKVQNIQGAGVAGEYENTTQYPELVDGDSGTYEKRQNTINYEVNEMKELIESQQGKVEDLSISVVIDSEDLDTQTTEQVRELVTMAVGTDPSKVAVHSMKFDTTFQDDLLKRFDERDRDDKVSYLTVAIIALLAIIIIIWIVYINKKRLSRLEEELAYKDSLPTELDEKSAELLPLDMEEQDEAKDRIVGLVDQDPEIVAQLLRNWINED